MRGLKNKLSKLFNAIRGPVETDPVKIAENKKAREEAMIQYYKMGGGMYW